VPPRLSKEIYPTHVTVFLRCRFEKCEKSQRGPRLKAQTFCDGQHIALAIFSLEFQHPTWEDIVPLENEYFPEQSSHSNPPSSEDRRAFKTILCGIFGIYTAAVASLTAAVIVGTNFEKAAHIVLAAWN
jgi:hypothetical protein